MSLKARPNKWSNLFQNFQKQISSNTESAQATLAVRREKQLMKFTSMNRENLKESRAEVANNEKSKKCEGKEYQENVSQFC